MNKYLIVGAVIVILIAGYYLFLHEGSGYEDQMGIAVKVVGGYPNVPVSGATVTFGKDIIATKTTNSVGVAFVSVPIASTYVFSLEVTAPGYRDYYVSRYPRDVDGYEEINIHLDRI